MIKKKGYLLLIMLSLFVALVAAGCSGGSTSSGDADSEETIKVGVLHSLSGTMAISEVSVHDWFNCLFNKFCTCCPNIRLSNVAGGTCSKLKYYLFEYMGD